MKYFLLVDMGYDGIIITQYNNESEASIEYDSSATQVIYDGKGNYYGVALIKGEIIANKLFFPLLSQLDSI